MRSLSFSSILILVLFVQLSNSAEPAKPAKTGSDQVTSEIADPLSDRNIQRSLPSGAIVGGNLVRAGEWYILSASEISAVRNSLKKERQFVKDDVPRHFPLPRYSVVFWGVVQGKIEPLDVLFVDRTLSRITTTDGNGGWYSLSGKDQELLRKAVERIEKGVDQPVAKSQADGNGTADGAAANGARK
jgi:hypothetical protein